MGPGHHAHERGVRARIIGPPPVRLGGEERGDVALGGPQRQCGARERLDLRRCPAVRGLLRADRDEPRRSRQREQCRPRRRAGRAVAGSACGPASTPFGDLLDRRARGRRMRRGTRPRIGELAGLRRRAMRARTAGGLRGTGPPRAGRPPPGLRGRASTIARRPSASSSSQPRRRGHAVASDSCATSTESASALTRRARASIASTSSCAASGRRRFANPAADRAAIGTDLDESQEVARQVARCVQIQRQVEAVGGLRDRARDAAGRLVAGDRERGALAADPGLDERVREVGERTGLARGIPQDHLDEAGLEPQAGSPRRLLDGARAARRDIGPTRWTPSATSGARLGCAAHSPRKSERTATITRCPRCDGRPRSRRDSATSTSATTGVEHLLELVDDHDVGVAPTGQASRSRTSRSLPSARTTTGHRARRSAGTSPAQHQRRLPAARRPGDGEEPRAGEPGERGRDVGVAPEELVLVLDAERLQPPIRAVRAREQRLRWRVEARHPGGRIADSSAVELGAGLDAEFVGESFARAPQIAASASACRPLR